MSLIHIPTTRQGYPYFVSRPLAHPADTAVAPGALPRRHLLKGARAGVYQILTGMNLDGFDLSKMMVERWGKVAGVVGGYSSIHLPGIHFSMSNTNRICNVNSPHPQ